ncbi:MAG TPA: type II toxin-antitoxin system Phd/YefM family antitoxin [Planctomycetota bacterium]|nr:type II toxin-antitoxin system Phd/YefM family antitoxin [Planctomycetota bacterium]
MKTATVDQIDSRFGEYLKASKKGPIVVTQDGKPVAVLVGEPDDDELERLSMAYSPRLNEILDAALARMKRGEGIPHEEFWARIEAKKQKVPRRGRATSRAHTRS